MGENSIGLSVKFNTENEKISLIEQISDWTVCAAFVIWLCSVCVCNFSLIVLLMCLFGGGIITFTGKMRNNFLVFAPMALTLIIDLIYRKTFINGLAQCINQILLEYGRATGRIVTFLEVSSKSEYLFLWTVICGVFSVNTLFYRYRSGIPKYFFLIIMVGTAVLLNQSQNIYLLLFLCIFVINILLKNSEKSLGLFIVFGVGLAAVIILMCFKVLYEKTIFTDFPQKASNYVVKLANNVIYGAKEPEIEVVMENPQPCYLKNFMGESFQNNMWQNFDKSKIYNWADKFYWINKSEFSAQITMKELSQFSKAENIGSLTVNVKSGSRKKLFIPYGIVSAEKISIDNSVIGGENFKSDGQSFYKFTVDNSYLTDSANVYKSLLNEQNNKEFNTLLKAEKTYSDFVKSFYLDISASDKNLLRNHFGEADEKLSINDVKKRILEFVSKNLDYYNNDEPLNDNSLSSTLEEKSGGNQREYALLTVKLLRYNGIPARYCEGYAVTAEDCDGLEKNSPIILNKENFHAWAEYYMQGLGWQPFETCPEYIGLIENNENVGISQNNSSDDNYGNGGSQSDIIEPFEENIDNKPVEFKFSLRFTVCLLVCILLFILIIISLVNRIRLAVNMKKIRKLDRKKACIEAFAYTRKVLSVVIKDTDVLPAKFYEAVSKSFSKNFVNEFAECFAIFEKARFSNLKISEQEYEKIILLLQLSKKEVSNKLSAPRKFIARFIEGVY